LNWYGNEAKKKDGDARSKALDTRRESSKMSITTFVGFFGKFSVVITLKACKEAKNVIVVGYQFHSTL
jgi:hypothetical protein